MNRAGVRVTSKFGWFIGRKDASYGYVCGYRRHVDGSRYVAGAGVRHSGGKWRARRRVPSGEMQTYDANCSAYGRRRGVPPVRPSTQR